MNGPACEALICGDRAAELGWPGEDHLSPAWSLDIEAVRYGKPPPWLDVATWDRELQLWACDCAERVLPVWEEWAREHSLAHLEAPREAVRVARLYAVGKATAEEMRAVRTTPWAPWAAPLDAARDARDAALAATWDAGVARDAWAAWAARDARDAAGDASAEREWQRAALATRLDAVAPWMLRRLTAERVA